MIVLDRKACVAINIDCLSEVAVSAMQGRPALLISAHGHSYKYLTDKGTCKKMFFELLTAYMDDDRKVFDLVDVENQLRGEAAPCVITEEEECESENE